MNSLLVVLFLPLATAILNRLLGARLGKRLSAGLAIASVLTAFGFAVASFLGLAALPPGQRHLVMPLWSLLSVGSFSADFSLLLDPLSAVMILVVTGVGALIHVYSAAYMEEEDDAEYARFFTYLNFFIFSMLTLVLAANFMVIFTGWELVGVSSYLLIGFYRSKTSAADAGKKAFIVNRVGDLGFLMGIFVILSQFGTLDFTQVLSHADKLGQGSALATLTALLLFMGAMGKSAQFPLHVWLPDAMEGPTPVSALIHAATMVTAGVFMVARCHAIFELSPVAMRTVAWVGAFTALFAASIALVQNDIKRVMAYSTLSQLGYMVMAVGVGAYTAGFFHLFTHAFFKALLFLGCGSVMHALHGELDMTKMGGLRKKLPITFWTFLIGAACLSGVPFTSGFFSKDAILYEALDGPHGSLGLWLMGALTAAMTAFYVGRLVFKTFFGKTRLDHHTFDHAHESAAPMAAPLLILAVLAIGAGFLGMPRFMSKAQPFEEWLAPVFADVKAPEAGPLAAMAAPAATAAEVAPATAEAGKPEQGEDVGLSLRLMAFYTLVVAFMAWLTYKWFATESGTPNALALAAAPIHQLLWNKWYVDELYDLVFVRGLLGFSKLLLRVVDQGLIDGVVNGCGWAAQGAGHFVRVRLHNGYARFYAGALLAGVVLLLGLVLTFSL
jgi:NADH-quinone oxidoreductase subunit L